MRETILLKREKFLFLAKDRVFTRISWSKWKMFGFLRRKFSWERKMVNFLCPRSFYAIKWWHKNFWFSPPYFKIFVENHKIGDYLSVELLVNLSQRKFFRTYKREIFWLAIFSNFEFLDTNTRCCPRQSGWRLFYPWSSNVGVSKMFRLPSNSSGLRVLMTNVVQRLSIVPSCIRLSGIFVSKILRKNL